jgi:hypothetical protein
MADLLVVEEEVPDVSRRLRGGGGGDDCGVVLPTATVAK